MRAITLQVLSSIAAALLLLPAALLVAVGLYYRALCEIWGDES